MKEWSTMKKLIWLRRYGGGSSDPLVTLTGKIISFFSKAAKPFKSTKINIDPVQDTHGLDPYPPGGGANKLQPFADGTYTNNGVTMTASGGKYTLSGTSSATWIFDQAINLPAGSYAYAFFNDAVSAGSIYIMDASYNVIANIAITSANKTGTFTIEAAATTLRIRGTSGYTYNNIKLSPMLVSGSTVPTSFSPYSNICPISGWTGADIFNEAAYDPTAQPKVSLTFGSTVYGGTATDNGDGSWTVKVFPYYASYNGEPLVGPWLSSMDKYAAGTTPTTGAQVVDLGGTQTTFTVSGDTLSSLVGTNNAWADTGNITAEVYGTPMT